MALPISAFIITKNEEARLSKAITALQPWIEDIVVVDSGSEDRTVEIARKLGARVFHRDWTGYGDQKRFAERKCRNDWVLNVDADEVVTPGLANEIRLLFSAHDAPQPGAYKINILNVYPGDTSPRPFARDYNVVRFYHRSVGHYRDHPVYDRVVLTNSVAKQLRNYILHYPYISFEHLIDKNNSFSSFRSKQSTGYSFINMNIRLYYEFPVNFIKFYVFRRHFTGGWKGFYFSLCHAFMRTSRIAKMLEQTRASGERQTLAPHTGERLPRLQSRAR